MTCSHALQICHNVWTKNVSFDSTILHHSFLNCFLVLSGDVNVPYVAVDMRSNSSTMQDNNGPGDQHTITHSHTLGIHTGSKSYFHVLQLISYQ